MIAKMAGAKPEGRGHRCRPGRHRDGHSTRHRGTDFTIFDRGDGFGGTWRNNTYPGAACDVPSHLLLLSYALNPRWSKTFANQPEILAYLTVVAAAQSTRRPPGQRAAASRRCGGRTPSGAGRWRPRTARDAPVRRRRRTAVGIADVPNIPEHSRRRPIPRPGVPLVANWDHIEIDCGLNGRVASGQAPAPSNNVPEIAPDDRAHLTVFQRTRRSG